MHALPHSEPLSLHQATAYLRLHQGLLDTHRQVWVSLLWGHCSFLLGPDAHRVLFVPSKRSVSLTLCKFCSKIPLAFKVKFPGGSQSLCQIPRLGNPLWALELFQQGKNLFLIIVLQFVDRQLSGSTVELTGTSSKRTYNLTYTDDTSLLAQSKEEPNSLLMKVKEESEKAGLKLNIKKMKIMALVPPLHGKQMGTQWKQ